MATIPAPAADGSSLYVRIADEDDNWSCWERWLCGQCSPSLERNVSDTAVLELVFNAFGVAALMYTAINGGLQKSSDWWSLAYYAVSTPTLLLLLWYVRRRHPSSCDAVFLRRFNLWCHVVLVAYSLGVAAEVWQVGVVAMVSQRRTTARLMVLLSDLVSLALFANIVYFNAVLLQRMHGASTRHAAEGSADERGKRLDEE